MSGDINERLISRISNRGERPSRTSAVALEPEVRTPIGFIPVTPVNDADRLDLPERGPADAGSALLGPYLFQWRYNVRYEDIHAFHDWLISYERELQKLCPHHFTYLGTYFIALNACGQIGRSQYCTLWRHAHHGGVMQLCFGKEEKNKIVKGCKDADGEATFREREDRFLRLLRELISFQDESSPNRESQLYQLASHMGRI
jgi:hypothetical protein